MVEKLHNNPYSKLDLSDSDGIAKIKVIGVGGGGGNAINNMIKGELSGVDFIAANTDKQALEHNLAQHKIQIGRQITNGLGAGANPEIGYSSVEESIDEIKDILKGSDMVFVTAGMGGGTGTGGAPIIAETAQKLGALTVAIVTKPFTWEGKKRARLAEEGINNLRKCVDALIIIPNQRLLEIIDKNTTFVEAFRKVDEVLYNATRGISDIIGCHGTVNVDFADVKTVMQGMGDALMGIGSAAGENRAQEATLNALNSPLLDGISINGAKGVLVNITGGSNMTMHEIAEAVSVVEEAAGEDANLIHGVVQNQEESDELIVTVVATGFNKENAIQDEPKQHNNHLNNHSDSHAPKPSNHYNQAPRKIKYGLESKPEVSGGSISHEHLIENDKSNKIVNPFQKFEDTTSPRGYDQLKNFDSPAYERRKGISTLVGTSKNNGTY